MPAKKKQPAKSSRSKLLTLLMSLFATGGGGSVVSYFWKDIVGDRPVLEKVVSKAQEKFGVDLASGQRKPESAIGLLGCSVTANAGSVAISSITPGTASALLGMKTGDVIKAVDNSEVRTADELEIRLAQTNGLIPSTISVQRGDQVLHGRISLHSDNRLRIWSALAAGNGLFK